MINPKLYPVIQPTHSNPYFDIMPRDVPGCVLDLRANKANYGQPHTLASGVSLNSLLSDMSVYRNHCTLANLGATATSGHIRTPVLSSKGIGVGYTNLVSNGDFSNGTTGWTVINSIISAASNTLSVTGDGSSGFVGASQAIATPSVLSMRYFVRIKAKSTNASGINLYAEIKGSTSGTGTTVQTQSSPVNGTQYTLIGIVTPNADTVGNTNLRIVVSYANAATANGKVIEVQQVQAISLSDNTQVLALESALGRVLTAEECDRLFAFTASSNSVVVDTPYSLALDGNDDYGSFVNTPSLDITTSQLAIFTTIKTPSTIVTGFILCKNLDASANVQYSISTVSDGSIRVNLEGVDRKQTSAGTLLANTMYNVGFIWDGTNVTVYINNIQSGVSGSYSGSLTSRPNMRIARRETANSYFKGETPTISIYSAPSLDIQKIIKSQRNIAKDYILGL